MNLAQFKDPQYYLCFHDTVVACWFATQVVRGSNMPFYGPRGEASEGYVFTDVCHSVTREGEE